MSPEVEGLIFYGIGLVLISVFLHAMMKSLVWPSVIASFVAALALQIYTYIGLGYLDPFFIFAFVNTFVIGLLLNLAIGYLFKKSSLHKLW